MALDPRLASPVVLALAALRLKQRRNTPALVVVYREDDETVRQAIRRTLGREPHSWETCLVVEYEAALPGEDSL